MRQLRVTNIFRRQKKTVLYLHKVHCIWTLGHYFLAHIRNESATLSNVVYKCLVEALWLLSSTQGIQISSVFVHLNVLLFMSFREMCN